MSLHLDWRTVPAVSAFHAAAAAAQGLPLRDAPLAAELAQPLQALRDVLFVDQLPLAGILEHLAPQAASLPSSQELAVNVVGKVAGHERAVLRAPRYAVLFQELAAPYQRHRARLEKEYPIRPEPLQSAWAAYGKTLRGLVRNWSTGGVFVTAAAVLLVPPLTGGVGVPHPRYNTLRLEPVAEEPVPGVPEVIRLCWLLSTLNLNLPKYAEHFRTLDRALRLGTLALVPVNLMAAEEAGLVKKGDGETLGRALRAWCPATPEATLAQVQTWWETYRDTRPPWRTALEALDLLVPLP